MPKPIVLKVGLINVLTGDLVKENKTQLTFGEAEQVLTCISKHINWGTGGCYGDGDKIIDKQGLKEAKSVLKKLDKIFRR